MLQSVRPGLGAVAYNHIGKLLEFAFGAQSGRSLALPRNVRARKEFDWLTIGMKPASGGEDGYCVTVEAPSEVTVPALGVTFVLKIIDPRGTAGEYNLTTGNALDAHKLPGRLCLRSWRAGDQFRPSGSRKSRKLKELFQRRKIPRSRRKLWPVLESQGVILWVRGFPPAAAVAPTVETRALLIIEEGGG